MCSAQFHLNGGKYLKKNMKERSMSKIEVMNKGREEEREHVDL